MAFWIYWGAQGSVFAAIYDGFVNDAFKSLAGSVFQKTKNKYRFLVVISTTKNLGEISGPFLL